MLLPDQKLAGEILAVNLNTFDWDEWQRMAREWEELTGRFLSMGELERIRRVYGGSQSD